RAEQGCRSRRHQRGHEARQRRGQRTTDAPRSAKGEAGEGEVLSRLVKDRRGGQPKKIGRTKNTAKKVSTPARAVARSTIAVQGARVHNLKNVSVEIPRDKLVVVTGLSGSGKSSLAFDTIYAEGQRRYMESLSNYAKRFVAQVTKPDVDFVYGLSPVISIEQKTTTSNPRSTVGTMTDIASYLNLLFATIAQPHCPRTNEPTPS